MVSKKYRCIVIDPPWDYGVSANKHPRGYRTLDARTRRGGRRIKNEWRESVSSRPIHKHIISKRPKKNMPYLGEGVYAVTDGYEGVMTVKEIKRFELVKQLADSACVVFLWTTNRFLQDAFSIIEAWGFQNIPLTLVWDKGCGPQFPISPSYHAEFVVVGRKGDFGKGNCIWKETKGFSTVFHDPPSMHSEKPAGFYRMIRRVTRGPHIDLFARRRHFGFDAWGNQVDPFVGYNDMFSGDFPKTNIMPLGTGELHYEDWEGWDKQNKQQELSTADGML